MQLFKRVYGQKILLIPCKICNKYFENVAMHVNIKHNLNPHEYMKLYDGAIWQIPRWCDIQKDFKKNNKIKEVKKTCEYCKNEFNIIKTHFLYPDLPKPVNYCDRCLNGKAKLSKEELNLILKRNRPWINKLIKEQIDLAKFIPSWKFFGSDDFRYILIKNNIKIAVPLINQLLIETPGHDRFGILYDKSWLKTLIKAKVLPNNVLVGSRGNRCLANDGHVCNSVSEKNIDDWLFSNNVEHEKEPFYPKDSELNPNGKMRADWKVGKTFVEFFGLTGDDSYDKKTNIKLELSKKYNLTLISIYEYDLFNLDEILKDIKK